VIFEPSVTTVFEIHFELNIAAIEVDNQMTIMQIQVGKNIVEDVLLDGRASVNDITKKPHKKFKFTQTKTNSIPPLNDRSEYD
jgi:hypothetical protein